MYSKSGVREGARVLLSAMEYLEKTYGPATDAEIDMRPWVSSDHPISTAHWILTQCRFKSALTLRGAAGGTKRQTKTDRRFTLKETEQTGIPADRARG